MGRCTIIYYSRVIQKPRLDRTEPSVCNLASSYNMARYRYLHIFRLLFFYKLPNCGKRKINKIVSNIVERLKQCPIPLRFVEQLLLKQPQTK